MNETTKKMSDDEFLRIAQGLGILKWKLDYPWSGFHIPNTCLIMRSSERPPYEWYISTYAFTIVMKSIPVDSLAEEFAKIDFKKLNEEGLAANERFRDTPDF